ncbi:ABC transporter substrate-binding protein [Fictibacillus phosphorivorans]|uniref:ABC transporter substrate-binding protein n=1 Tax=Fictibacillus phosphorivorans TaxID=1221500 RepID=UPI00203BA11D|nr:ABC transporter substrate-binding protein [Fictibacillus phosphorivorans]MCM3717470.1 ABC transporter substrate-binding protein [Fictibacillus phosphorivorans]MCM3775165.1 ABC transporter substrate-binding protein [Fictibacillus phosphorivorans]
MKKLKKISKVISTSLALSLVLAACSDKEDGNSQSGSGDKDEKVKIVYARGKDDTQGTKAMVEAFEKKYPNIDVEFKEMPADTGKQHDAYVTAFNANSDEIDVIDLDVIWPAEFAQAGFLMPLDRFIEKDGVDLETYNEGAISAAKFKGKQWALPKFIDAGMLFYRTDLVPEGEVPKTWDELLAKAKETKGQGGTQFGYLMQAKQYEGLVCNAVEFIASYGGKIIDENGEVKVDSPEAVKGISKLVEIVNSDVVPQNITTFAEPESHTAFINGQAGLIRNWPYQYALANDEKQSKIAGKVAAAPLPAGDAGSAATLGGWMAGINKNTKHPEESWKFLSFMAGKEGQKIDAIKGGHAPTILSLYDDEEVLKANPYYKDEGFVKALEAAVSRPVAPNYPEISDIIQVQISQAIAKKITPEEAAKNMQKEISEKLEK